MVKKYSNVFQRLRLSKNSKLFTLLKSPVILIKEKGRRVPFHIQAKVGAEIRKLRKEGHIIKLDKCASDQVVAQVITKKGWHSEIGDGCKINELPNQKKISPAKSIGIY